MMIFEAYYQKWRLAALALLGLGFAALGGWMISQAASDFEGRSGARIAGLARLIGVEPVTFGHGIGWICLAAGLFLPFMMWKSARHKGPAMRVDEGGIYWHHWSDVPIPWDNIAEIKPYTVQSQRLVGLTLIDRSRSPGRGLLGKSGSLNKAMGYGDLALSLQGTDGKYQDLLDSLAHFAERP